MLALVWFSWIALLSIIAGLLYAIDKRRAIRGKWRIPEKVLLSFGFFGGAAGALLAMRLFHHKTRHPRFWVINIIGLLLHITLSVFLMFPSLLPQISF